MNNHERYSHGEVSCIEALRSALSPEEFRGFCKGNVIKYIWRERYKGRDGDIAKAIDYCEFVLESDKEDTEEKEAADELLGLIFGVLHMDGDDGE